jgi:hypothetical protein
VLEFVDHALDGRRLLALLFQTGQRGLQDFGRRLAEAAAALAVEMDRRRMQAQQHRCRLHGIRFGAVVLGGEILEAELLFAADFPEEIDVDAFRFRLRPFQQFAGCRCGETQQDVGGLDLAALARGQLDLQRGHVVGQHAAGTEGAVLFKQDIHGGDPGRGCERNARGRIIPAWPWRAGQCWSGDSRPARRTAPALRRRRRPAPAVFRRAGARGFPPRRRRDRESPASRRRHR